MSAQRLYTFEIWDCNPPASQVQTLSATLFSLTSSLSSKYSPTLSQGELLSQGSLLPEDILVNQDNSTLQE